VYIVRAETHSDTSVHAFDGDAFNHLFMGADDEGYISKRTKNRFVFVSRSLIINNVGGDVRAGRNNARLRGECASVFSNAAAAAALNPVRVLAVPIRLRHKLHA